MSGWLFKKEIYFFQLFLYIYASLNDGDTFWEMRR